MKTKKIYGHIFNWILAIGLGSGFGVAMAIKLHLLASKTTSVALIAFSILVSYVLTGKLGKFLIKKFAK